MILHMHNKLRELSDYPQHEWEFLGVLNGFDNFVLDLSLTPAQQEIDLGFGVVTTLPETSIRRKMPLRGFAEELVADFKDIENLLNTTIGIPVLVHTFRDSEGEYSCDLYPGLNTPGWFAVHDGAFHLVAEFVSLAVHIDKATQEGLAS